MVKKAHQSAKGGLNDAGRAHYKRTEGANLKPPVTAKAAKKSPAAAARRESFCARSSGIAEKFPESAKNPNSRLSKARKRWDC